MFFHSIKLTDIVLIFFTYNKTLQPVLALLSRFIALEDCMIVCLRLEPYNLIYILYQYVPDLLTDTVYRRDDWSTYIAVWLMYVGFYCQSLSINLDWPRIKGQSFIGDLDEVLIGNWCLNFIRTLTGKLIRFLLVSQSVHITILLPRWSFVKLVKALSINRKNRNRVGKTDCESGLSSSSRLPKWFMKGTV